MKWWIREEPEIPLQFTPRDTEPYITPKDIKMMMSACHMERRRIMSRRGVARLCGFGQVEHDGENDWLDWWDNFLKRMNIR